MITQAAPRLSSNPWTVHLARIARVKHETPGVATYDLVFDDVNIANSYRFQSGQFNMLYLPGVGEAAISLSSDPAAKDVIGHTVRAAGNVTRALARLTPGGQIGVRGPFGRGWPIDDCRGADVVIAAGGIGLAPLRPVIYQMLRDRSAFGSVWLLYGARSPSDLLFSHEFDAWRNQGIEVLTIVDRGDARWRGQIGVVPTLLSRLRLDPRRTRLLTCGPEIMMRFVIFEALARGLSPDQIHLSIERNMNCAVGLCGHCQLGPEFLCKDGPVFTWRRIGPLMRVEDL